MKPRHAAALALVGWYLMEPPIVGPYGRGRVYDASAPLSRWYFYNELKSDIHNPLDRAHATKFRSKDQCDAKREEKWPANPPPIPPTVGGGMTERIETWRELGAKSLCVSADDPRLKAN
jgi:hypothetical protein